MKLKDIRVAQGFSQADLSRLTGIAPQTISRIETGKKRTGALSGDTLLKLADALDCDMRDLIDD